MQIFCIKFDSELRPSPLHLTAGGASRVWGAHQSPAQPGPVWVWGVLLLWLQISLTLYLSRPSLETHHMLSLLWPFWASKSFSDNVGSGVWSESGSVQTYRQSQATGQTEGFRTEWFALKHSKEQWEDGRWFHLTGHEAVLQCWFILTLPVCQTWSYKEKWDRWEQYSPRGTENFLLEKITANNNNNKKKKILQSLKDKDKTRSKEMWIKNQFS